jgi:DNA-binding NarL/FixJ family response regulator
MSIRVLVADDNPDVRDALAAIIGSEPGLEVAATAADAAEAVQLAARDKPDVALIDMRMPGGGGVAAARGIAAGSPQTRIIALTASGTLPESVRELVIGALAKGIRAEDVVEAVKRAADGLTRTGKAAPP